MSVHQSDRETLGRLIRIAERVLLNLPAAASVAFDLATIEVDVSAAIRCRGAGGANAAEAIVFAALAHLATARLSIAEAMRFALVVQHALPMVRDHYFAAVMAEAEGGVQ